MSGPFGASQFMYASGGFYSHEISHSIRFDDGSSEYLSRTPGSAGNRKTMTWSGWFKRSDLAGHQRFFGAGVDNYVSFTSAGAIEINLRSGGSTSNAFIVTNNLHRDVSAWYHIVVAIDTTQGTDTNRVKIYVNGVQQTSFSEDAYPSQNNDLNSFNNTVEQFIGRFSAGNYYDGYMAEVHFIDGLALTPASFGETKNDIWIPKNTSGLTYGTQGFRLQFKQAGLSANASGLGADTSGNTNHLNSVNHAANDRVPDSPTNNFCLPNSAHKTDNIVFSEGNTKAVFSTFSQSPNGTIGASSGKWYYEVKMDSTHARMGFCESHCPQGDADTSTTFPLYMVYSNGSNGLSIYNSVTEKSLSTESGYTSFSGGDTLGIAFDIDNGKLFAHLNGTYYNSGDPAGGTGALITSITAQRDGTFIPYLNCGTSASRTFEFNFGAPSHAISSGNADENGYGNFEYAVPSGFLSLCTANLPDPVATIDPAKGGSPQDYFSADIFTGNGTNQDIDIDFDPDLIWTRQRTDGSGGAWMDRLRGDDAYFQTPNSNAEGNFANITFVTDGYNVSGNSNIDNEASHNYVGWAWKAGGSGSSNTDGAINTTSTSVATHGGFSISTYTGTGSSTTVGHGLGGVPDLIIIKRRNSSREWYVYNSINAGDGYLYFQSNAALETDSNRHDRIGNGSAYVAPTSTLITLGTSGDVNGSSDTYVMYCFRNIDGMQKIGSYTGNANSDGSFAHCGFRPEMVIIKSTSATESWNIFDTSRDPSNLTTQNLNSNSVNAESDASSGARAIDILSNGFKARGNNSAVNDGTFLYLAFAKQPFKYANAR